MLFSRKKLNNKKKKNMLMTEYWVKNIAIVFVFFLKYLNHLIFLDLF